MALSSRAVGVALMRALVSSAAVVLVAAMSAGSAAADEVAQLDPLAKSYTLGRFRYEGPDADGWRQIANAADSLQLLYVEQMEDNKINKRCHVVLEIDDLPPDSGLPGVAELAATGRKQHMEKVKEQVAAVSPIAAVPGVDNAYTYRFLLHAPPELGYDYYQVYYVVLAPDKSQYVVVQLNTRDLDYENQLYFQQFYATLARLKYQGAAAADAAAEGAKPAAPSSQSTPPPPSK